MSRVRHCNASRCDAARNTRDTTAQSTTETISPAESFPHDNRARLLVSHLNAGIPLAERFARPQRLHKASVHESAMHPRLVTSSLNDIRAVFTCDAAQSACERFRHRAQGSMRAPNGRYGKSTSTGG